jgi:hypothetical protein
MTGGSGDNHMKCDLIDSRPPGYFEDIQVVFLYLLKHQKDYLGGFYV